MGLRQLLMYLFVGLNVTKGLTIICKEGIRCKSHNFGPASCKIKGADVIVNAIVVTQISERRCFHYKGTNYFEGLYGYNNNILWVNQGCQAIFKVCFSVKSSTPPSDKSTMSTISTSAKESSKTAISTSVAGSSKSTLATTVGKSSKEMTSKFYHAVRTPSTLTMVYSYSYSSKETKVGTVTTEQQSKRVTQSNSREGSTVEIVVPVCLMSVFVVVLGIMLWRKRRLRKQKRDKQSINTDGKIKQKISFMDTNSYETPMVQKDALEKDTVKFCRTIHFSSNTSDQKGTEVNPNSMPNSHTVEIPGNSHEVVDFQDPYIYSSIDENHAAVQSMPDNEYNVINTKRSLIRQDNNYDTLQDMHINDHIVGTDEYSKTGRALVKLNDTKDYDRVKLHA